MKRVYHIGLRQREFTGQNISDIPPVYLGYSVKYGRLVLLGHRIDPDFTFVGHIKKLAYW